MTVVETIESEIKKLSLREMAQLRDWFMDYDADAWNRQIEQDAAAGKLDAMAAEALAEYHSGQAQALTYSILSGY